MPDDGAVDGPCREGWNNRVTRQFRRGKSLALMAAFRTRKELITKKVDPMVQATLVARKFCASAKADSGSADR